jgi:hypothetical protein
MSTLAASLVDWSALGKVAAVSAAGGIGISVVFGCAVIAGTRAADLRAHGRRAAAAGLAAAAGVALLACAAAVAAGLVAMLAAK